MHSGSPRCFFLKRLVWEREHRHSVPGLALWRTNTEGTESREQGWDRARLSLHGACRRGDAGTRRPLQVSLLLRSSVTTSQTHSLFLKGKQGYFVTNKRPYKWTKSIILKQIIWINHLYYKVTLWEDKTKEIVHFCIWKLENSWNGG